jgi:hypothetical protein
MASYPPDNLTLKPLYGSQLRINDTDLRDLATYDYVTQLAAEGLYLREFRHYLPP